MPTELERIVGRALEKNRELRYQSAADVKADLLRIGRSTEPSDQSTTSRQKPRQIRRWAGAAALAIVMTAIVVAVLWKTGRRPEIVTADALPLMKSIAVLPLENLSHDLQHEYLADGITDELITNLSKIASLRVIARGSVMRYKSQPRSIPEIARELNVDAVLKGTVLASGNRVRISTRLIDASSEKNLWEENHEGGLGDVFALQTASCGPLPLE